MKIQVLSDLHVNYAPFIPSCDAADVVVLAGDIDDQEMGVLWALEYIPDRPVIYVLGNHEYHGAEFPSLVDCLKRLAHGTNVHLLENDSVRIGETAFHGCTLWTDFALFDDVPTAMQVCGNYMPDFFQIEADVAGGLFTPWEHLAAHEQSKRWLLQHYHKNKAKHNVIVTHHAPSMKSVAPRFANEISSAAFASHLDQLVLDLKPDLWVHGHTHTCFDYPLGQTRIVCNPRGYPNENPLFNEQLLIEL